MVATKIVNEREVLDWFEQRRTYTWMAAEYRRKYGIDTTVSLWSGFRRRHGLDRRIHRDDDLIPWHVIREHRWAFPAMMLRAEARRRAGLPLAAADARKLTRFLQRRVEDNTVVHYDPDTDEGFSYVPPRPTIDTDIIRRPDRKTTLRPRID